VTAPAVPKIAPTLTLMLPMRDGVRLYTEVFLPAGAGPFPTVLMRTPYPDPTFPFSARPIDAFRTAGYAVAVQSCRGTWLSEGAFRFFQNEPEDGYDCVEQLAEQPWCSGRIGMSGSSYLGSVQWLAAKLRPPHLTCIAPQSPAAMFFYETPYVGGALFKRHLITWPRLVSATSWDDVGFDLDDFLSDRLPDADHPILRALAASPNVDVVDQWHEGAMAAAMREPLLHSTYDAWWERIMLTDADAAAIDIPVLAITGFHDGDQAGALYNWAKVEDNETTAAARRHLLVGPWRHAQMRDGTSGPMGAVEFGPDASVDLTAELVRFFDTYLSDEATDLPARCRLFVSGTNRWHATSAYPPVESRDAALHLSSGGHANSLYGDGRLTFDAPGDEPPDTVPADWRTPVPVVAVGEDCRDQAARHDVLVYTSEVLPEDVTVLGQVRANLYVAADAPDADIVVRVEDLRPDGSSINMTGELGMAAFRARYRYGFDSEVPLVPGKPALLPFHVCHMGHTFLAGHRIRVSICATAHPAIEPNHHTGEPVATAVDRRTAVETVFHDAQRPSHLVLPLFRSG
jgi:putative CocE/NonD family hydrolase